MQCRLVDKKESNDKRKEMTFMWWGRRTWPVRRALCVGRRAGHAAALSGG